MRLKRKKNQVERLDPVLSESQFYLSFVLASRYNFIVHNPDRTRNCIDMLLFHLSAISINKQLCGYIQNLSPPGFGCTNIP